MLSWLLWRYTDLRGARLLPPAQLWPPRHPVPQLRAGFRVCVCVCVCVCMSECVWEWCGCDLCGWVGVAVCVECMCEFECEYVNV